MRLTLTNDEVIELMEAIAKSNYPLHSKIQKQYEENINRDITKKRTSIQEATKRRERTAKNKIINAINMLRLQGKEITPYAIAKESGCSYNTVKKYHSKGVIDGR